MDLYNLIAYLFISSPPSATLRAKARLVNQENRFYIHALKGAAKVSILPCPSGRGSGRLTCIHFGTLVPSLSGRSFFFTKNGIKRNLLIPSCYRSGWVSSLNFGNPPVPVYLHRAPAWSHHRSHLPHSWFVCCALQ